MSPSRRTRRLVIVGAALGLGACAAVALARLQSDAGKATWLKVQRGDLVISVPVTGSLAAIGAASLGPPSAGEIYQFKIVFMAPEGSPVHRGDAVLAFDASDLEKVLHDKEAERDSAAQKLAQRRANLEIQRRDDDLHLAEAAVDRRRAMLTLSVPPDLKSRHELDEARADLALAGRELAYYQEHQRLSTVAAEAELTALSEQHDRAAQRVAESRAGIARLRIAAPRDGTVIYTSDSRGGKKKVGDPCWLWEQVLSIPDLTHLQATGEVDEADSGQVAAGQRVVLRLDAHPELSFDGRVRTVRGAVQARSAQSPIKVVKLAIDLAQTDALRMRPGMRFTGRIEAQRASAVLLAPLEAVTSDAQGALVYRRALLGSEALRPRLGRHNDLWVEVLGGLRQGDFLRRSVGEPAAGAAGAATAPGAAGAATGAQRGAQ
jgi:HlyD family secretion protein